MVTEKRRGELLVELWEQQKVMVSRTHNNMYEHGQKGNRELSEIWQEEMSLESSLEDVLLRMGVIEYDEELGDFKYLPK